MERNVTVIKDADGNKIIMINDIRFKGKRAVNWDDVKAYLKERKKEGLQWWKI